MTYIQRYSHSDTQRMLSSRRHIWRLNHLYWHSACLDLDHPTHVFIGRDQAQYQHPCDTVCGAGSDRVTTRPLYTHYTVFSLLT